MRAGAKARRLPRSKFSLSVKFALLSALLVAFVAGTTSYLLVHRFGRARERAIVDRDRELSRVLAGLRDQTGQLDFPALASFVASAERTDLGVVYAMRLDARDRLVQGALNPRVFSRLDQSYRSALERGHRAVLQQLAAGKLDRRGRIKEYVLPTPRGSLRLGFDLRRIDRDIARQSRTGALIMLLGLLLGVAGAVLLARRMVRPIRELAGAMEAVARGDLQQTVRVGSRDELASLAGSFNRMMRTLRDGGRGEQRLAPYLAPPVLTRLLREDDPLELVTEERRVTVLSLSFGPVEELRRPPRERLTLINEHLAPVIDAVRAEQGTVLLIDGSEPMLRAVWGAPDDIADAELRAVRAALAARQAVQDEARRQELSGAPALRLRAGICTGRVAAGNIGSIHRASYGISGQAIDVADGALRLARPGELLCAETTMDKLNGLVAGRPAAPLMLPGHDEAIALYRLVGTP